METLTVIPDNSPHKQVIIACIAVVGLSVLPLPYAYYFFLRIVIFGSLLWLALREVGRNSGFWTTGLGAVTILGLILYNPLLPVHLGSKLIWFCLNLAGLFLIRKLMTRDLLDLEHGTTNNPKRD
ncbi:DUF6804 family protein [Hellea balneolensis]|uniref:DUF6804 family protein n=1 Tax=Hellea balneolensis TaxID=287478 RepID=UPI000550A2FE|nr:DUF6804 family protein [Hellea balneolensis]